MEGKGGGKPQSQAGVATRARSSGEVMRKGDREETGGRGGGWGGPGIGKRFPRSLGLRGGQGRGRRGELRQLRGAGVGRMVVMTLLRPPTLFPSALPPFRPSALPPFRPSAGTLPWTPVPAGTSAYQPLSALPPFRPFPPPPSPLALLPAIPYARSPPLPAALPLPPPSCPPASLVFTCIRQPVYTSIFRRAPLHRGRTRNNNS